MLSYSLTLSMLILLVLLFQMRNITIVTIIIIAFITTIIIIIITIFTINSNNLVIYGITKNLFEHISHTKSSFESMGFSQFF